MTRHVRVRSRGRVALEGASVLEAASCKPLLSRTGLEVDAFRRALEAHVRNRGTTAPLPHAAPRYSSGAPNGSPSSAASTEAPWTSSRTSTTAGCSPLTSNTV